jgi:tetratricopeptide (TPR) repeat protein
MFATSPRIALLLCVLSLAPLAHADDAAFDKARAHSDAGRAFYSVHDYAAALREFSISYEITHLPELLVNMGQCHRKLKQPGQAREMYQRFLSEAPANDPARDKVQHMLREVEHELLDQLPEVMPPPPPGAASSSAAPASAGAAPVVGVGAGALELHERAPAPPPRSSRRKLLTWVLPSAAALVVVGVGVSLGVYFGTRTTSSQCPSKLPPDINGGCVVYP